MTALSTRASVIALAAVALTALALEGCTSARSQYAPYPGYQPPPPAAAMKPSYPTSQAAPTPAPAPEQPQTAEGQPPAAQAQPAPYEGLPPVNRRPGAPPPEAVTQAPLPPPPSSAPASPSPQAYAPPPPRARSEPAYVETVKGEVRSAKSKVQTIIVDNGDTVNNLSERYLISKEEFIKANKLKKPYELDVGQHLKVPTPKAYVVEGGDTLYSIGRRFNVSTDVLGELNNIEPKGHLREGQEVVLPVGMRDSGPLRRRVPGAAEEASYTPTTTGSYQPPVRGQTPPPSNLPPLVESAPPPSDSQVAAAGQGLFIWPVRGDILSPFGPKPGGQANDGLNIASPTGTSVKAAAAGDVVYAGNQVPGYGNLVLIKHDGGWVTAYAFLSKTSVRIKDHLQQGDEVGEVGQTGGVDLPQLHFEIRYAPSARDKARPIDPALVLPGQAQTADGGHGR